MAVAIALNACGQKETKVPALDLTNLDTSVSPGEDFYMYATHGWQVNNPLKPEYSRFGTFDQLAENNVENINNLFKEMTAMKTEPVRRCDGSGLPAGLEIEPQCE